MTQVTQEIHRGGALEVREAFPAEVDQLAIGQTLSFFQYNDASDGFAPFLVGNADHGGFHYIRMGVKDRLDVPGWG